MTPNWVPSLFSLFISLFIGLSVRFIFIFSQTSMDLGLRLNSIPHILSTRYLIFNLIYYFSFKWDIFRVYFSVKSSFLINSISLLTFQSNQFHCIQLRTFLCSCSKLYLLLEQFCSDHLPALQDTASFHPSKPKNKSRDRIQCS